MRRRGLPRVNSSGVGDLHVRVQLWTPDGVSREEEELLAQWCLPASHYLESWGDLEAADSTISIVQPLIAPLHSDPVTGPNTRSSLELLAWIASDAQLDGYSLVQGYWRTVLGPMYSDRVWRRWLHDLLPPALRTGSQTTSTDITIGPLGTAAVPAAFRPMKLPWISVPATVAPVAVMPSRVLPEITLRSAAVVPPITLLAEFHSVMPQPLAAAALPVASRPTSEPR